jgi:pimeloyl-ACP methyl ester carboxylesterase
MPMSRKREQEAPPEAIHEPTGAVRRSVLVDVDPVRLPGDLVVPAGAVGIAIFAHGSGSGRGSPRNVQVARRLNEAGVGTLLFDLLTPAEAEDRANVFDVDLLARRLEGAEVWLHGRPPGPGVPIAFFGASTGAAAALVAASRLGAEVAAVVSRGGRPDLAGEALPRVTAPTLLIVGGDDTQVLGLNRQAEARMRCERRLEVIPGATHLFEEPGTLERVSELAAAWLSKHLLEAGRGRRATFATRLR